MSSLKEWLFQKLHKCINWFLDIFVIIFSILIILIFLIIILSIFSIGKIFYKVIVDFPLDLNIFLPTILPLVECVLLDVVLFILAIGIFTTVVKPIAYEEDFKVECIIQNFTIYLSPPFLSMIASMLAVLILQIAAELYCVSNNFTNINETLFLYRAALIFAISFSILAISILIKIEHGLAGHDKTTRISRLGRKPQ
jgi:hypothetical protein